MMSPVSSNTAACLVFYTTLVLLYLACLLHEATGDPGSDKVTEMLNNVAGIKRSNTENSSPSPGKKGSSNEGDSIPNTSLLLSSMKAERGGQAAREMSDQGQETNTVGQVDSLTTPARANKGSTWYSTAGWLPSSGVKPDRSVNLAVLPMLAFGFFVFGVCIKCYSWMRDQDRSKSRGQLDFEDVDEANYGIITVGEQGYREVDIRSDCTSMYDTVTSFRSFRLPANDHTVTSIKSLPNQPYNTYRSVVLKKGDEGVYDSVHSYKAFLEKTMQFNDVDIVVEQINDYPPRPRSKSYDQSTLRTVQEVSRSRKRRLRHHSAGHGIEGKVKTHAERERHRRHSDKSTPAPPHPDAVRGKTFHRRSSPAILEPLLKGTEFRVPLDLWEEEEGVGRSLPLSPLDRQCSNSSSTSHSSNNSGRRKESAHRQRREKLRQKRASQDALAERAVKASSHSSGHCSDDSPQSSSSCKGSSSNELDSDSDVTDSGLVVDLPKPARQSCFKHSASRETSRSQSPGDLDEGAQNSARKVHRFKVSFVDDKQLAAAAGE